MAAKRESALNVRVTEEHDGRRRVQQSIGRLLRPEDVLVLVVNRSVNHGKSAGLNGALRKLPEILKISGLNAFARPEHGGVRNGIKFLGVRQAGDGLVVIAANGDGVELAHALDHFVGIGTVTYQVAEADGLVPFPLGRLEDGIEGRHIRMNVAKDQIPQANAPPGKTTIIDEHAPACTTRECRRRNFGPQRISIASP